MWQVIAVKPIAPRTIEVAFADGTTGQVQFETTHLTGVYAPLNDARFFSQVFVENGVVAWPGNVEMAPDAMYDAIKTHGKWRLQ